MIRLDRVAFRYPEKQVFSGLTLELPGRGAAALMAPSGYGKTTLLRLLAGLLQPDGGAIRGMEGRKCAFLFQEDRLLPWLTAEENVSLVSNAEAARHWLAQMEIPDGKAYPREMSGGMQRRAALARAMAFGGEVLLLDEPFKGLDEALRSRVARRIRGVFPLTVLAIHDPEEAALLDAQIIHLDAQ